MAVRSGAVALGRRKMRRHTLVLAYHNVVPDSIPAYGDKSLHLCRADFAAQLDALRKTHEVVPLTEILRPRAATKRPRAAITFDDAYTGAVTIGIAELLERGLPATIFVAPEFVEGGTFWWDVIAEGSTGLHPEIRERALTEFRGMDREVLRWFSSTGGKRLQHPHPTARVASIGDLEAAAREPGITIGSHTWSHPNLTRLSPEEIPDELEKPLSWLGSHFPDFLPWLSYPYGAFDERVVAQVARAGYEGALAIRGGWASTPPDDRFAIPRVNIPAGVSLQGFQLRAAGFLST